MRILLVAILMAGALWQGGADWQRTIGEGYAYRLTSIGTAIERAWPQAHSRLLAALKDGGVPYAWDPVGATLLALPLALVLLALAALVWFVRPRRRGR